MARFFVPRTQIRQAEAEVLGAELDHLRRALRLVAGDRVTLFDDSGREHEAVIRSLSAHCAKLEILRSYETNRESPLNLTLALGLTKGEKMDFVVEKATELGVQTVVPLVSTYTVPRLDEKKVARRAERWQKIALSASKQSGRTHLPTLEMPCAFTELVARSWGDALKLFFWEGERRQTLRQVHAANNAARSAVMIVGAEGGFSDDEAALARSAGFHSIQMGPRILRAETAAVAAIALVQFLWGDLH